MAAWATEWEGVVMGEGNDSSIGKARTAAWATAWATAWCGVGMGEGNVGSVIKNLQRRPFLEAVACGGVGISDLRVCFFDCGPRKRGCVVVLQERRYEIRVSCGSVGWR